MRFSLFFSALTLTASLGLTGSIAGCATSGKSETPPSGSPDMSPSGPPVTRCEEPRPQVCTMIFAPVCATHVDGHHQTHASACNACADDQVATYVDGACETPEDSL